MPHIALPDGLPGIVAPMTACPATARHLNALAEELLRSPSPLTPAERELIAAYTSRRNATTFCMQSHAAATRYLYGEPDAAVVDGVLGDVDSAPLTDKMRARLAVAAKVQEDGKRVTDADVARARAAGADDRAIHDTVLVAAAFCMYNRYVDGLATRRPEDPAAYVESGARLGAEGYLNSIRKPATA